MWQLIIGLGASIVAISEVTKNWGWNNDWRRSSISNLPQKPGVYVLYARSGKVIHVGSTGNLFQRISYHPKRNRIHKFNWKGMETKEKAYEQEMLLHKTHSYNGK